MYDIYGVNSTKLSVDEGLHVIPGFRLASGISEAMLELQEMDLALFKEMLKSDYQELKLKQSGYVSEAKIEAIHEGLWQTIKDKLSAFWDWLCKTVKSIWKAICDFFGKIWDSIVNFFGGKGKTVSGPYNIKVTWYERFEPERILNGIQHLQPFDSKAMTIIDTSQFSDKVEELDLSPYGIYMANASNNIGFSKIVGSLTTIEKQASEIPELDSPDHIMATCKRLKDLQTKANAHITKLTSSKPELDKWVQQNESKYKQAVSVLREYSKFMLKMCDDVKKYFAIAARTAVYMRNYVYSHSMSKEKSLESNKDDPNTEFSTKELDAFITRAKEGKSMKESVNSILFDPEFIREMSDYDFDEMYESCYIDNTGAVVCNG